MSKTSVCDGTADFPAAPTLAGVAELRQNLRLTTERHRLEQERLFELFFAKFGGSSPMTEEFANTDMADMADSANALHGSIPEPPRVHRSDSDADGPTSTADLCSKYRWNSMDSKVFKQKQLKHGFTEEELESGVMTLALKSIDHPLARTDFAQKIASLSDWWVNLREPERKGFVAKCTSSSMFEAICFIVIVSNCCFTIFTTNYSMKNLTSIPTRNMEITETMFVIFYIIELLLKLGVHRLHFFANDEARWNVFDSALVSLAILDQVTVGLDIAFMRSLRLLKVAKVLRMFRVLRFFSELRLMLDCLRGSFMALFWACLLLVLVTTVFSIFLVQGLAHYLHTEEGSEQDRQAMRSMFKNVFKGVQTLMFCSFGSDPFPVFETVRPAGALYASGFICYILSYQIAVINILTSLFIEKVIALAQPDTEMLMLEKRRTDLKYARELTKLLEELDVDASGTISRHEFLAILDDPKILAFFELHGLDVKDAEMFHKILSHSRGSDEVGLLELVDGCLRMRGYAQSVDLIQLLFEVRQNYKEHSQSQIASARKLEQLTFRMNQLSSRDYHVLQGSTRACSEQVEL